MNVLLLKTNDGSAFVVVLALNTIFFEEHRRTIGARNIRYFYYPFDESSPHVSLMLFYLQIRILDKRL